MMNRRPHTLGLSALRTSRFTRFFIVPLTLVALFSGCYKWVPVTRPFDDAISTKRPLEVRVARADGSVISLRHPEIRRDSIRESGLLVLGRKSISLEEVEALEAKELNAAGVVLAGITLIGLAALFALGVKEFGRALREPPEESQRLRP
jgi:hypothetical protein